MSGRAAFLIGVALTLNGCMSSAPKSGVLAPTCRKTAVSLNDMQAFGFKPAAGKITVVRIFASWCPFCKTDLNRMSELFRNQTWTTDTVQVLLLAYHNRDEDLNSFNAFRDKGIQEFAFPPGAVQMVYVDQNYAELEKSKSSSGQALFTDWKGVPFGMVFGKDGRLAFRGHFTMSDGYSDNHYRFITDLTRETCKI